MTKNRFLEVLTRFGVGKKQSDKRVLKTARSADEFAEFSSSWGKADGIQLKANALKRVLRDAENGSAAAQALLFRKMLETEPAIAAHMQTRILSVLACDWSVQGRDAAKAEIAAAILRKAGIQSLMRHLLEAVPFGYAGAAVLWEEGGRAIQGFRNINAVNWAFDLCGNPALLTLGGCERPLTEYHENQFVFHTHSLGSENPACGGLLRPLVWLYFFKHYAMRDRARYLERFGIPFIVAKIRSEDFESETVRSDMMNSLARLGSDGVGLLNEGADMQILNPGSGSAGDYQACLDYLDRMCAVLILGQRATSESSSGFSNGSAQEHVRRDLIEADCRALMETVNRQILEPLEKFRWGTSGDLHFHLDYSTPENMRDKAEVVAKLASIGAVFDPEWLENTFSVQIKTVNQPKGIEND